MSYLLIYTIINAFGDGKYRPGFKIGELLFVLSSTEPKLSAHIAVESAKVDSIHYNSKKGVTYITTAYYQEAVRYNNKPGGKLYVDDALLAALQDIFGVDASAHLIREFSTASK